MAAHKPIIFRLSDLSDIGPSNLMGFLMATRWAPTQILGDFLVWFDTLVDRQRWIYPQFMPTSMEKMALDHTPRNLWYENYGQIIAFHLEARTLDIKYPSFYGQHDCGNIMFSIKLSIVWYQTNKPRLEVWGWVKIIDPPYGYETTERSGIGDNHMNPNNEWHNSASLFVDFRGKKQISYIFNMCTHFSTQGIPFGMVNPQSNQWCFEKISVPWFFGKMDGQLCMFYL